MLDLSPMIASATDTPSRSLVVIGYASFVLIGWNTVLLPSLIRSIERDFHQTDAAFGLLYLVSAVVYAAASLGGGVLTERIGRRAVLSGAVFVLGGGLCGEALASTWFVLLLAAVAVNVGGGAIDGGVNGLFLDLFRHARGGALNLLHLFFGVGALVAPLVIGGLVAVHVDWRAMVLGTGLGAMALAGVLMACPMPAGRHRAGEAHTPEAMGDETERSLLPFAGLAVAIGCYVAAEISVSSWLVKFLSAASLTVATGVLSGFWGGLALGRLLSNRFADRFEYVPFTVTCMLATSTSIVAAVLVPMLPATAALFALAGLFSGPIYPMIMAIGGNMYPHRLSALSGSLSASAVVGSIFYPPLIGIMARSIGIGAGLIGAGMLGIPAALALLFARSRHRGLTLMEVLGGE